MKARQSSQKLSEKSVWEPQLDAPVSGIQLIRSNLSLFCTLGVNILEHSSAELVKGMKSQLGESVGPTLLARSGKGGLIATWNCQHLSFLLTKLQCWAH